METTEKTPCVSSRNMSSNHSSLGKPVRLLLNGVGFILMLVLFAFQVDWRLHLQDGTDFVPIVSAIVIMFLVVAAIPMALWWLLVSGVRIAAQWERGILLRLGKFKGVRGPGQSYLPIFPYSWH